MRKILFLLSVFTLLVFAITNCDDTGANIDDGTGTTSHDTTQTDTTKTDTTQKSNTVVGTWYEVGSAYTLGRKVIFTDTTITAYRYYNNPNDVWFKWFDDNKYFLLNNDTLEIAHFQSHYTFKTYFMLHSNDTLKIQHFALNILSGGDPYRQYVEIILYRSDDEPLMDTTQKSNPLVGEWYGDSTTVVFTETTVTGSRFNDNKYLFYNDTLEIENPGNISGLVTFPFTTPITFHSNDTMEIKYFIETPWGVPFPYNYNPITIYRR